MADATSKNKFQILILHPKKRQCCTLAAVFASHPLRLNFRVVNNNKVNVINTEKCSQRIWKRCIVTSQALLMDLLISNNFSSSIFFCEARILRVIGCQSISLYDSP